MQRTQFYAKSAKNDLEPTDFLKRKFYFEIEGAHLNPKAQLGLLLFALGFYQSYQDEGKHVINMVHISLW
jgi:hypothetical protein